MRRSTCLFLIGALLLISSAALGSAAKTPPAATPQKPADKASVVSLTDPAELKALKYRSIGPAWGGRVSRVSGVPGDPSVYYAATASGGVWKSNNGGFDWKPVFDGQPVSSIGSMAVAPSNPNVIYVGSGEANIRGNVAAGNGIYRSTDAGKTWSHVWKQEGQIGTIVVHPRNADIAWAAVLGHAFGPNPERGVYRTRDGGRTWEQVLKKDENTGASDVALDASNPNIVFAGLWQARRSPWDLQSGGPGSGLYMSRDGGDTWARLSGKGLPEGIWGKVGVAVAPSDGRRVYALIEAAQGGLYRSDDGGDSWTRACSDHLLSVRAWYYSTITVNPANSNEVWCPEVTLMKSIDGGRTFSIVRNPHWDHHDLWIDPLNPKRLIGAADGGVKISFDAGETWFAPPLPIGQFYHVSADSRVPFHVAGALQDLGTAQGPSRSLSAAGVGNSEWHGVGGGEAGWVVSDPSDPNIVYAGEYGGYISRYDHRAGQARNVSIFPEDQSGYGAEDLRYRFQWTAPIAVSPHDPRVIYHGANVLFKTADGGQTWTAISPDLTRNDKSKQKWAGGPITGDNTGVEVYGTIFTVAESPLQKGLIWAGTDDGLVQVTLDGGQTWKNVTAGMTGFPEWGTVSLIEPSRFEAGTAYVVVDAHRLDNTRPYLYKTSDFGRTWGRLDAGLPQDIYLHAVREDTVRGDILYLGTERGVSLSTDGGLTWHSLKLNLPTVAVHDLVVKDNSLVLATHGRSFWVFDHLDVIREMSPQVASAELHLFKPADAIRWRFSGGAAENWTGENPPGRATFCYWLKTAAKDEVKIEVLDAENNVIETLSSKPKTHPGHTDNAAEAAEAVKKAVLSTEAGIQAAAWDMSYAGAELILNAKIDSGDPFSGPMALPGTYTVRLSAGGRTAAESLKILPDPRTTAGTDSLKSQLELTLALRDDISRLTGAVNRIRSIRQQLAARDALLKGNAKAEKLVKDSAALVVKLDDLEARMHNPGAEVVYDIMARKGGVKLYSRMAFLFQALKDGDGPPTQGMREAYAAQKAELGQFESEFKGLLDQDLAAINEAARRLDLPHIIV